MDGVSSWAESGGKVSLVDLSMNQETLIQGAKGEIPNIIENTFETVF